MKIIKKLSNKIKHLENGKILIDSFGYCYAFDSNLCLHSWNFKERQWQYIYDIEDVWDILNLDHFRLAKRSEYKEDQKGNKLLELRK